MPRSSHLAACCALGLIASAGGGCTLVKPVACAVTAPVYVVGKIVEGGHCGCYESEGWCYVLAGSACFGAAAGLVTGIISDVQVLCGRAEEPTRNWWNPVGTNTTSEGW